jgi:hypothetical protein
MLSEVMEWKSRPQSVLECWAYIVVGEWLLVGWTERGWDDPLDWWRMKEGGACDK